MANSKEQMEIFIEIKAEILIRMTNVMKMETTKKEKKVNFTSLIKFLRYFKKKILKK